MASNTEQRMVVCENGNISYLLTRKPVKNVNLRIKPEGTVIVSANDNVPIDFIDGFIEQKQKYILSALDKYNEQGKWRQKITRKYVSGENINILGKSLRLKVEESNEEAVYTDGVYVFLKVKDKNDFQHKEIMTSRWLRQCQISVFEEIVQETYNLFKKYEVPYPKLKIRYMISRWGSCQSNKGIITLNSRLIEKPRNCIEYVVLHEFVHFIYPNHSRQFWNFITMMMPDWKERKEELER